MRRLAWHQKLALALAAWSVLAIFVPAVVQTPRAVSTLHAYLAGLRTRRYAGAGWGTLYATPAGFTLWSLRWVTSFDIPQGTSAVAFRFLPATCPGGGAETATVSAAGAELARWALGPDPVWHTVFLPASAPVEEAYRPPYIPVEVAFHCTLSPASGMSALSENRHVGAALTGIRLIRRVP